MQLTLINTITLPEPPQSFWHLSELCDDLVDLSPGYPAPSAWHFPAGAHEKLGRVEIIQEVPYIYFKVEAEDAIDYGLVADGKLEIYRAGQL